MNYLDELRAEITVLLNPPKGECISQSDMRRIQYLEGRINNHIARYDY